MGNNADGQQNNPLNRFFLMIDMEDASVCEDTIAFYNDLKQKGLPVAITLQAYLYRTDVIWC